MRIVLVSAVIALTTAACGGDDGPTTPSSASSPASPSSSLSFFVTSATSSTANLGGLRGADATCQRLASAVGAGGRTWRAYLSAERDPDNGNRPTNARDRIGGGPWVNARGVVIAASPGELHGRPGNAEIFVDERGERINGQWTGSPGPNQHDILTGSTQEGLLATGLTCSDWTSASPTQSAQVGHSDGLGPNGNTTGTLSSWNAAHTNGSCADTAPRGGAGRFYCFAQ